MSSKAEGRKWAKFCKLLDEAVKDEDKAHNKDYPKLKKVFKSILIEPTVAEFFEEDLDGIISDEGRHHDRLKSFFTTYCKRNR